MEYDSAFFHTFKHDNQGAFSQIIDLTAKFKVLAMTGPRQSGKTTLVKALFKEKTYLSLENPDTRKYALDDPRGFLKDLPDGAILDEVQRTPEIFSYLQEIVDSKKEKGQFILTGSNNFLLQQNISQSLAGRVAILNLLPFSVSELFKSLKNLPDENTTIINGFYPPVHDQKIASADWYPNYIRTYIEQDVRQIKNVTDLIVFERFMRLLAGRTGQELNLHALGIEAGVDSKTIQSWISILESSYIIYLLKPHFKNFNKTIVKRPKVYFYDTGLICSLLGVTTADQLRNYPLRGSLFENMVVTELYKRRTNTGKQLNLYFWRDKTGYEIDVIIDNANKLLPIEIKSGKTISDEFFKNMIYWNRISNTTSGVILYAGDQEQRRSNGIDVSNWFNFIMKYDAQ